jgi:shikimate dehydrogenase
MKVHGKTITHTAKPQMHQPDLDANGIDARYIRLEVEPGQVREAFARMRALGFIGCNVTVPHKLDAMANCTDVHPDALALGAVNTVRFDADAIRGFNTDGPGFARAIEDDFGVPLARLKVAIAGAGGGAGQAVATQCVLSGVEKLVLVNRSVGKLGPLEERLRVLGSATEITSLSFDAAALADQCRMCDLSVDTSSVGLKAGGPAILSGDCLKPDHLLRVALAEEQLAFGVEVRVIGGGQAFGADEGGGVRGFRQFGDLGVDFRTLVDLAGDEGEAGIVQVDAQIADQ